MLRRASDLAARARERIRAAREHDPHAWPERDDDRAILVHDDEPIDVVEIPDELLDDAEGSHQAPARQPRARRPGRRRHRSAVSGPPQGGRPHRPAERSRRLMTPSGRGTPAEDGVPNGLRTAAAWSWRLIVVIVGFYVLLYAAAYVAVVVVPVIVALLLAALLQPGAACAGPARLAAVAGRLHDADRRARRRRRDHHAGRRAVLRGLLRPRRPGQRGHRAGAELRRPHVPDHPGPARGRRRPAAGDPGRQPGHDRLRRAHHRRDRRRGVRRHRPGAVHAVLLPQGRPLDLAVAGRPLPPATPARTSTRRPAARGGR